MSFVFNGDEWQILIDRALESPDLSDLYGRSGLRRGEISTLLEKNSPEVLGSAPDESKLLESTSRQLQDAEQQLAKFDESPAGGVFTNATVSELVSGTQGPTLGAYVGGSLILLASLGYAVAAYRLGWKGPFRTPYVYWLIIPMFLGFSIAGLQDMLQRRRRRKLEESRKELTQKLNIEELKTELANITAHYQTSVLEKGLVPELRGILNKYVTPSYSMTLADGFTARGLTEVYDSTNEVSTDAKKRLDDLMSLPGGSIGVAGPRGAGKSTLLLSVANRVSPKGTESVCNILCSAPVEYVARDFILNLFSLVCLKVLKQEYEDAEPSRVGVLDQRSPIWQDIWVPILQYGPSVGLLLGSTLLAVGLLLGILLMPPPPAGSHGQSSPGNVPTSSLRKDVPQAGPTESSVARFLKNLDIKPGPIVLWGVLLVLGSIVIIAYRPFFSRSLWVRRKYDEEMRQRESKATSYATLEGAASQNLRNIRFLQSYSSGWSGSLKLPFVEGGINTVETLAGNQQSLPEIVERIRRFLVRMTASQFSRVTICIDEMDKLESDEKAYSFLNEIKAIFGIKNVFYLVSVSESAISNFERRGLPFRDVFDSSFDAILYVNYLNLEESKRLLKRRTTKIPEPFLCFCHCLSGGLPRDLIRACREVLHTSKKTGLSTLPRLSEAVLSLDIKGKTQAVATALSKLNLEHNRTLFLGRLAELAIAPITADHLLHSSTDLLADAKSAATAVQAANADATPGRVPQDLERLLALYRETAMYLYYAATLIELFGREWGEREWLGMERSGAWDEVARVRQSLALNPAVGGALLSRFRVNQKLRALDLTWMEVNICLEDHEKQNGGANSE